MPYTYVLCRPRPGVEPAALLRDLIEGEHGDALATFDAEARRCLLDALARLAPELGPAEAADGELLLQSRERAGIDVRLRHDQLVLTPIVAGSGPAAAEALFARLNRLAAKLCAGEGLVCYSPELSRLVDFDADHEALARAWLRFCTEAAREHVEASRRGGSQTLVAGAVMIALLLAIIETPAGGNPWAVLAVVVGLPLLVLVAWRYLLQRRRRG